MPYVPCAEKFADMQKVSVFHITIPSTVV